jgi:Na+/H+-dicarboxylate symporter
MESHKLILIGIAAGILLAGVVVGVGSSLAGASPETWGPIYAGTVKVAEFLGRFFVRALQMIIVPLVLASVVVGVTQMGDVRELGWIGLRTITFYLVTTAVAIVTGIALVLAIRPGIGVTVEEAATVNISGLQRHTFSDLLLSFLDTNVVSALANQRMLPIIVFAIVLGAVLTTMGSRGKPLTDLFDSLNEAMMRIIVLIMWVSPIGVFGLVVWRFGEASLKEGGLSAMLGSLAWLIVTVLVGLVIHAFITMFLICWFLGRRNPLQFLFAMAPALLTAWSTASSSATLPLTMECATKAAGIKERAAGFVLPLGATVNMDGTALYQAVGVLFIAHAYGVELTIIQLLLIVLTALLASIGTAGVPQAGTVMMVIVLNAVGLPVEGIGLVFAVDWFLDRFRTVVNVWGDAVGAAFVDHAVQE